MSESGSEPSLPRKILTVIDGDTILIKPDSTSIKCFGYNKVNKKLYVQFLSNDKIVYVYPDVSQEIFNEFRLAERSGKYWSKEKNNHKNFTKMEFSEEWVKPFL